MRAFLIKLDGYRAIAFKADGRVHLRSHNDKDFTARYPSIASALSALPDETVIDGEVVALDLTGKPSFNLLQNHGSSKASLVYYVFDVLTLAGRDVMSEPLSVRRELLSREVMPKLRDPIRESPILDTTLPDLIHAVKAQGLEGLVAKRRDSRYEPGQRSRAWQKLRVNQAQDFVIGCYTTGGRIFDALIFGYYDGPRLIYAARTRNGFTPSSRKALLKKFKGLETIQCPFANLPEARPGPNIPDENRLHEHRGPNLPSEVFVVAALAEIAVSTAKLDPADTDAKLQALLTVAAHSNTTRPVADQFLDSFIDRRPFS